MPISKGHTSAKGYGRDSDKEPKGRFVGKGNKASHPKQTKRSKHHRDPTKEASKGRGKRP